VKNVIERFRLRKRVSDTWNGGWEVALSLEESTQIS
jgi:hypothetical protein